MPSINRMRAVTWTLNNYTEEEILHINNGPFKFLVYQKETGANGTPHLQGYAQANYAVAFTQWKKLISPRAHLAQPKGSPRENYDYCTKEDTRDAGAIPFVIGDVPQPGQRTDLEGLVAMAKDPNKRMRDIVDANPEVYLKYHKGIDKIRTIFTAPRDFPTEVYWLYGTTGTGKSRYANGVAPGAYWKPGGNNWWDGYDPAEHEDIIIDDFRSNLAPFSEILRLFDRYPMSVPFKGGYSNFRPKRIFVTTSRPPETTWLTTGEEALGQLLRRLKVVVEFLPGGIKRFDKGVAADLADTTIMDPALHPVIHIDPQEEEGSGPELDPLDDINYEGLFESDY